jgi:transcriptional regulator with GAF, ATPase, and Fis domain
MVAVGRQHSDEPLPPQTEARLAAFTELIATAIANAEAHDRVRRLADEQSALRRVATLVAGGAPDAELFAAVAREVSDVTDLPMIGIDRYEQDGSLVVLASPNILIGSRFPIPPDTVGGKVFETRAPVRIDSFQTATSDLGVLIRDAGMQSAVSAPIFADGSLWGVLIAEPIASGRFRPGRSSVFCSPGGRNSIANAAARRLTSLAEQAALRHARRSAPAARRRSTSS